MATFNLKPHRALHKAAEYFRKLDEELDLEKYKLDKYKELFMLASFQTMHDADMAYHYVYQRCALNSSSKETLLCCLEAEARSGLSEPGCFDRNVYRQHVLKAISEIRKQLTSGVLDYLYS
ncbi:MAG TPA: hypothetical protein VHB54_09720 [Mucilaginibacter sp.]|nr:hypothetical protein [Mucilaginibacter sp.]